MVTPGKSKIMKHLLLVIVILLGSCKKNKFVKDDELSIQRTNYTGNQLRINGYYYQLIDGALYGVYCFYANGVIQHLGDGYKLSELAGFEQLITTKDFNDKSKAVKYFWGVFKIEGNSIQFERWYPSEPPYKAYVRSGTILNDSTFKITESYRMQGGQKTEVTSLNETYHFKKFSPKPDSTNAFVP